MTKTDWAVVAAAIAVLALAVSATWRQSVAAAECEASGGIPVARQGSIKVVCLKPESVD